MRNRPTPLPLVVALLLCALPGAFLARQASAPPASQVFQGEAIEKFLREAKIVESRAVPVGITAPRKLKLEMNGVTEYALFKTIDVFKPGLTQFQGGKPEVDFQDSYKLEIAAYELDKIVGLGMVPATVERQYNQDRGSLQFWVTTQVVGGVQMSEKVRLDRSISPPDVVRWNQAMYKTRMWDNLIGNVDRNVGNVLITPDWTPVLIDHSRTFRRFGDLPEQKALSRFSRTLLAAFGKLDEQTLRTHLGKYLNGYQIKAILQRRDKIAALAKTMVEKNGESVLFD